MIELIPLTSALHVSYDLTTWRDSTIPIHYAKPTVTREVSSVQDSRPAGKPDAETSDLPQKKKFLLFIGLTYLNQKDFPNYNHKVRFPMKQGHCFPFSVPLRADLNLKDQLAKLGCVVACSRLHSPSSRCPTPFPQRKLPNMFCFYKTRRA